MFCNKLLTMRYIITNTSEKKGKVDEITRLIENSIKGQKKLQSRLKTKKTLILKQKEIINFYKQREKEDTTIKNKFRKLFKDYYIKAAISEQ